MYQTILNWDCQAQWTPYNSCEMVVQQPSNTCPVQSYPPAFNSRAVCKAKCKPPEIEGYIKNENRIACKGNYMSIPHAHSPQECAKCCNNNPGGYKCTNFMYDPTKSQHQFQTESDCLLFYNCDDTTSDYPATIGSVLYTKLI